MSEEKKSVYFFWQIFGLTGILHCHFIWFRVPWDSQVGGQNVKLKTVQQPGISHWHWKWIWFMSIFKNILLAVILLSWDRVHYGDNILSKHHPLLCLRYKCQHIWKDMLLLFKRGGLQLKAISSNRGCKVFSLGGGVTNWTFVFLEWSNSVRKSITSFWAQTFWPEAYLAQIFQTERARRLTHLPSFCKIV